jgi:hypothetical protein
MKIDKKTFIIITCFFLCLTGISRAEIIYTKDKKTIDAKIIKKEADKIWYQQYGGKVGMSINRISKILNSDGSLSLFDPNFVPDKEPDPTTTLQKKEEISNVSTDKQIIQGYINDLSDMRKQLIAKDAIKKLALEDETVLDTLIERLQKYDPSKRPGLRTKCIVKVIGELGPYAKKAEQIIIEITKGILKDKSIYAPGTDSFFVRDCLNTLNKLEISPSQLIPLLQDGILNNDPNITNCIMLAIEKSTLTNETKLALIMEATKRYININSSQGNYSARSSFQTLGRMKSEAKDAVPLLKEVTKNHKDKAVREAANKAIYDIQNPEGPNYGTFSVNKISKQAKQYNFIMFLLYIGFCMKYFKENSSFKIGRIFIALYIIHAVIPFFIPIADLILSVTYLNKPLLYLIIAIIILMCLVLTNKNIYSCREIEIYKNNQDINVGGKILLLSVVPTLAMYLFLIIFYIIPGRR